MGNIWLAENKENQLIDRYLNLTDEIVCINSIGENVLQRLSGSDFDSDTVLLTDNEILIKAARRNYHTFKTPTSFVTAKKVTRYYTPEEQADLDIKTSVNKIGEIINLSQELNSLLWDKLYHGYSYKEIRHLYYDICQLDVMSGIEIDNSRELDKIREKYKAEFRDEYDKKKMPHFFSHISKQKGYYNPEKKNYCKYHTSMDYLQTAINGFRIKNPYKKDWLAFVTILDKSLFRTSAVNQKQINRIYSVINQFIRKQLDFPHCTDCSVRLRKKIIPRLRIRSYRFYSSAEMTALTRRSFIRHPNWNSWKAAEMISNCSEPDIKLQKSG